MPSKTATPKPTATGPQQAKPTARKPRQPKVADVNTGAAGEGDAMNPNLKRHIDSDAAMRDLRIETMAHALIYDISSLRDVAAKLHQLQDAYVEGHPQNSPLAKFFAYYVPRLEVLLEADRLMGDITTLSDLGEWLIQDIQSEGEHHHYQTILGMMKVAPDPTPVQLAKLLERSALFERSEKSRGESWIPKQSRRASAS